MWLKNELFLVIKLDFGFCEKLKSKSPQTIVRHNYIKHWDFLVDSYTQNIIESVIVHLILANIEH